MWLFAIINSIYLFNSVTAYAAARAVSAIYVSDGFWQAEEVMQAPSVTNTLGASQT